MRILITSYVFHPVIGGITTVSSLLAAELAAAGHEVRVVTATAGLDPEGIHYEVIRNPSPITLWKEVARCDVLLSVHLSVRLAWPLVFLRKPWVIAHHSWLTKVDGSVGFVERLKRALLGSASCISVSQAVANHVDTPSVVIGPPYDEVLFGLDPAITREWNLLFVGRLVSSKGLNVLLEALAELRRRGHTPRLTVVGAGPELPRARELARQLELEGEVDFVGSRTGADLRATYCSHKILVVPSIVPETFGVVALEAIACGCVVVGSDGDGGLTDAIGPCGVNFPTGNSSQLADRLIELLDGPAGLDEYRVHAEAHASRFTARRIASLYLEVIENSFATFRGTRRLAVLFCILQTAALF